MELGPPRKNRVPNGPSKHWALQRTVEVIRLVTENSYHIIDFQLLVGLVAGTVGRILHIHKENST